MPESLIVPGAPAAGWTVLIGGGEFSFGETAEIDRFLASKMPGGNRRIAFLPTASGSPDYAKHLGEHFRKIDSELELINVPVYRARDVRRGKNLETIRDAGMVYLGGGVTNLLAETLRDTPVVEAMREALERGALVAGIGAGAACLAAWTADAQRPGSAVRGFGWLPAVALETGFHPDRTETLARLMSIAAVQLGIGIPASTALAIGPDRRGTILGDGEIAVVRKGAAEPSAAPSV